MFNKIKIILEVEEGDIIDMARAVGVDIDVLAHEIKAAAMAESNKTESWQLLEALASWKTSRISDSHQDVEGGTRGDVVNLFISYAHSDAEYKDQIYEHLGPLIQGDFIRVWLDDDLIGGSCWDLEIKSNIARADIVLFIISSSFFSSEYCYRSEMQEALARSDSDALRLMWVLARDCFWEDSPLAAIQGLPRDHANRLVALNRIPRKGRDKYYAQIAREVSFVVKDLSES